MSTEITKQDKIFFILKNIGIGLYILLIFLFFIKSPLLQLLQSNVGKTKNLVKKIKTTYRELAVLCIFYFVITVFTVQFILEQKHWKRTVYILLECFMTIFIIGLFLRTNYETRFIQKNMQKKKNWFKQFQNPMIKK